MLRLVLVLFFIAIHLFGGAQKAQKLKRRCLGTYVGNMPSYLLDSGKEVINVESTEITVQLSKDAISFDIGRFHMSGNYRIIFKNKDYWVLDATVDGQLQSERITVYKKQKKIIREGVYPQPNATLEKR